ncbi:hypothetical protein LZ30DRAFT_535644, partial [Colletotrichum cereale]
EIGRANDLIQQLVSELHGQQTELKIMADKVQSRQELVLDLLNDLAAIAKTHPENLNVEIQRWRTVITEWDQITCVNDRSHEIGTLVHMANARDGR